MSTADSPRAPTNAGATERGLERSIGVRALAASIVNITVGGGIFLIPAIVAGSLGAASWLAYVVAAIAFALIVICFAEAGSRVAMTGGPYAYVETAFGPFAGYLTGALVLLFGTIAHAAVASGFTQAVNALVPGAGVGAPRAALLVLVFALFTAINVRGVRQGARMVEVGTVAKLVPLCFLLVFGLFAVTGANLAWPGMPDASALTRAAMMLMFAFFGLETALLPSGEVRDPARTVPRAIALAITTVTILYVGVQVAAQGILGADLPRYPDAPLTAAAGKAFGSAGGALLLTGAAISMMAHTSGMMLAMPRSLFAFARDGYLPRILAAVHPKTHVPTAAIITYGAVACALAISGTFSSLLVLGNITALLMYLLCCLAVLGLRRKNIRSTGEPFSLPGGTVVPWLASGAILVLLSTITGEEFLAVAVALAIAIVLYVVRRRTAPRPLPTP